MSNSNFIDNQTYLELPDPIYDGYVQNPTKIDYFENRSRSHSFQPDNVEQNLDQLQINQYHYQVYGAQEPNHLNYYGGQQDEYFQYQQINQNNDQYDYNQPLFNEMIDPQVFEDNNNILNNQYPEQQMIPMDNQNVNLNMQNHNNVLDLNQQQQEILPLDQLQQFQNQHVNTYEIDHQDQQDYEFVQPREEEQLERAFIKANTQNQTIQTTKHTFNTAYDKYQNLGDNEDDTKNLLRNYGNRLKKDIQGSKENRDENKWIINVLTKYIQKHKNQITDNDEFIDQFYEKYSDINFSNFLIVREYWTVQKNDQDLHLKNAFREICFYFFSKNPLNIIYRESNKLVKYQQRFTHLKYLHVFLKGIIDPPTFLKFKESKKEEKREKNYRHTSY